MDFRNIIFYVKDIRKAVEFYEKAFGFKRGYYNEETGYGEIETNKTFLGFMNESSAKMFLKDGFRSNTINDQPAGYDIHFVVKDVDKTFKKAVEEGAKSVLTPTPMPWGQTIAYVRDINGILIAIGSEMEEHA